MSCPGVFEQVSRESDESPQAAHIDRKPDRSALFLLWVFCFFLTAYFLTTKGYPFFVDEELMLETTASIVEKADFDTPCHPWTTKPGRHHRCYSNFGIGQSLYEIPFYLAAQRLIPERTVNRKQLVQQAVSLSAPVIAALLAVQMILCTTALGFTRKTAFGMALLLGFGTMIWPYSKMLFRDPLQNLLLFSSITTLIMERRSSVNESSRRSFFRRHLLIIAGILLGAGITVKETMVLFAPLAAAYAIIGRSSKVKRSLVFGIPVVAGCLICLIYNFIRFENCLDFGYTGQTMQLGMTTPLPEGLFGLLFSSGRSIFLYNPVLVLAIPAIPAFFRRFPKEGLLLFGVCLVNILFISKYWTWGGSWAWGPRFLLIMVPLMILPIAVIMDQLRKDRLKKYIAILIVIVSIAVQIPGVTMHIAPYLSLIANDVKLFPLTYNEGASIRNDLIHVDFIPQFSPLWGLSWTLKHSLTLPFLDRSTIRENMKNDCPWGTISSHWIPENPDKALGMGPDLLITVWKQTRPGIFPYLVLVYLLDAAICVFCYYRIRKKLVCGQS